MRQYSFLSEGPVGDDIKLKYGHLSYKFPNNQWKSTSNFWQGFRKERSDKAKELLNAHRSGGLQKAKEVQKKLLRNTGKSITRYEKEHGRLPISPFLTTFSKSVHK